MSPAKRMLFKPGATATMVSKPDGAMLEAMVEIVDGA